MNATPVHSTPALHHRVVAVEDGIDHQLAKPGMVKILLRSAPRGKKLAEEQRGDGDDRHQRVAKRVLDQSPRRSASPLARAVRM